MWARLSLILMSVLMPVLASGQSANTAPSPAPAVTAAPIVSGAAATAAAGQITVPPNTAIPVELRNSLNSRTAYVGQAIYCNTIYPIAVSNRIIIPVGSYVKGQVTEVTRPGRVKGKAQIGLRFDEITLANGVTKPLRATLSGFGGNGKEGFNPKEDKIQGEASKGKDAETVLVGGAEGAGIGSVASISSHRTGLGAGVGGATGAVGGMVYVLATRGKEVVLPRGTSLELELAAPLSYYGDEIESPSSNGAGPELGRRDPGPGL